jgi:dihydroxy-acid dehydratase
VCSSDLDISDADLAARKPNTATVDGFAKSARGWQKLYIDHVMQADTGCDLDFLVGSSGEHISRESH